MPITDLSVVVLPAPLRPRSVTTSPDRISKSTPCRMCDSPYQACRPCTRSSGAPALAMTRSQVGLDDLRVAGHALVVALGEDLAPLQDGDGVRKVRHHREVMLDHEHGPVRGDA